MILPIWEEHPYQYTQEIGLGFLEDYTQWDIVSDEEIIGYQTYVIEGKFNEYYRNKHNAESFKLWVHKDTGVLLKLEEYDHLKNVVVKLETHDIKFNGNIDNSVFKINEQ